MSKNIRSNYIKSLMDEKDELNKTLRESTKDMLKDIIHESVNENLRSMISEADDDDYDEEEADANDFGLDDDKGTESGESTDKDTDKDSKKDSKSKTADDDGDTDSGDSDSEFDFDTTSTDGDEYSDDDAVWSSLEQYKDEDGEYDLTGMGTDDVVKVMRVMKPEDGIRVVKNGDGNITLTDDNNDTEYIIQIDTDEPMTDDVEYELEVGDDMEESYSRINEYDSHVGYTDNYQKVTAMTTPPNDEPANPKTTYSMDDGVPKGTSKPWAGKGDRSPYTDQVDECDAKLEEQGGIGGFVTQNSTAMSHDNNNDYNESNGSNTVARNGSRAGLKRKGTSNPRYSNSGMENSGLVRKANQIFNENKQLKEIAGEIKDRLSEACVINSSLGKIIKLVTENTTTRDEKIDIVNRFNNVKNISEANRLYETISKELKNAHPINNTDSVMNGQQLAESRQRSMVETSMYQSDDLAKTRDLMERVMNIGKK